VRAVGGGGDRQLDLIGEPAVLVLDQCRDLHVAIRDLPAEIVPRQLER
jgi:hypothetical protein